LRRSKQELLTGLIGLDHLIAEGLDCRTRLTLLLAVLNHQHGHPSYSATPLIDIGSSLGVFATQLGKPSALKLQAVVFDQWAKCTGFNLHG